MKIYQCPFTYELPEDVNQEFEKEIYAFIEQSKKDGFIRKEYDGWTTMSEVKHVNNFREKLLEEKYSQYKL